MRILMITQWFYPEPIMKGLPFAKELSNRGHEVEVLTGFPNYPDGKIYEGYQVKIWQREILGGILVNRVPLYPDHSKSGILRILNYLSFSFSTLLIGSWLINKKPDVIYVFNLVTLYPVAVFLAWRYNCKIIYDVQDLWPDSVKFSGMLKSDSWLYSFLERWSITAYKRADSIVVQSTGFQKRMQSIGIEKEKTVVIYNWADENNNTDSPDEKIINLMKNNTFNVVFAGTMGVMQHLEVLLEAACIISNKIDDIHFFMIGTGVEKKYLQNKCSEMNCKNVFFVDRQPRHVMGTIYKYSHALIVHLKDNELFEITIPSKTQAYLAAGRPIIMAMKGDAAKLVKQAEAGYVCFPDDPYGLSECIKKIYFLSNEERKKLGENGKKFYYQNMSFQKGIDKFEYLFLK